MIKTSKYKRIIAFILLIITMLSIAQPIFAVSGTGSWVGGQFASYIKTTDNANTQYGILLRRLINYNNTNEQRTVFCAEHGVDFDTGTIYKGSYYTPVNSNIRKACKIAYLGWYKEKGDYVVSGGTSNADKKQYVLTQQFIWETLGQSSATFIDSGIQAEYVSFKNNINNQIAQMEKRPSFDGATLNIQAGESKTFEDSNGVLSSYPSIDKTTNGIRVQHSGGSNSITIMVDENTNLENYTITDAEFKSWGMIKDGTQDSDTMVFFEFADGVQNQLYCMDYNDPITLNISLKIETFGKLELQKLNTNGDLVNGAVYNVVGTNDYNKDVEVANGKIVIEKLKKGIYYVKEKSAPTGYLLDTNTYQVDVKVNQTATQAIINKEPTGKISVYKVSENNDKIGGSIFLVSADEDIKNVAGTVTFYKKNAEVGRITTANETGLAEIEGLPIGRYTVKEINAPAGYLLNEKTYTAVLEYKNETTPVVEIKIEGIVNKEPTGTISIVKEDSETGKIPQGNATFNGASYDLIADEDIYNVAGTKKFYSKGNIVATRIMNEEGTTDDITNLPLGRYKVKETRSSAGYLLDTKEYVVELKYKDQNTKVITSSVLSKETVKKMQIHIFKSGIKTQSGEVRGLEGAEFTIKLASDVDKAYAQGYSYAEVWNGVDEVGNKVNVNSTRVQEAQILAPTYDKVITDENGDCYTKELPYGKYIGKETKTPIDFETATDFYFSITQDKSEITEVAKKVKDIFINNEQLETYIKLVKKDKDTGKIVTASSATFKIRATKDIYDRGNGKILYKKGDTIKQKIGSTTYSTFTTNADNLIVPAESYNSTNDDIGTVTTPLKLEVGSYEIYEVAEPEGFLILQDTIKFKVEGIRNYDQDNDKDYILEIEIKNEQPTGTLLLNKLVALRDNVDKSLIDTSDLSKIKFRLIAKENIIDKADNSVIYEAGTEIGIYNLTKEGILKIERLPMGSYQIEEIETLDGLILNDTKYDVIFTQKDNTTKVYEEKLDIENETTIFEFSKTDITGDNEIVGAKIKITDENSEIIDIWTSTEETHKIEGLAIGKEYTMIEELAPEGFVKATAIKFKVESTTELQKVVMIDKIVEISKVDIAGEEIEGALLQVYDGDEIIDEWTSTKEAHKVSGLIEGKTYILHEEVAVDNFVKATDIEFTVSTDKETQKITMIDKIVEISKADIAGEEIEGALLQVYDGEEIIDEWTSTKEAHKVSGLIEGKTYRLHEKVAVDNFVKATDIEFTVSTDKENQKITMIDKIVEISKTDIAGEEIEGASLKVYDKDNNIVDEWVSEKEAHKVSGLTEGETYTLHEEVAVGNFVKATDIEFTVDTDKETQKITMIDKLVTVSKEDITTGEELEGAILRVVDEEDNVIDEWVSAKEPHEVKGLEEGKIYFLEETTAPYGYEITERIEFTVSTEKETQKLVMKDMPILTSIKLTKIDEDTKEIIKDKFTFGLYADEECKELIMQIDSNKEEGTITFEDLRYGIYYIKEISAPKNYILSDKVVKLEINDKGVFIDDEEIEETDSIYNFEYSNKIIETPKTSDDRPIVLWFTMLGISGISLCALGIYEKLKNKKKNK